MSRSRTALLFGEVDERGVPQAVLAHFGTEAYEHYMVAPYVRELLMVRNSDYLCWSPCFKHLYAAIQALDSGSVQFEELGSTLFSTIDKIEKLDAAYTPLFNPVNSVNYVGIEVSTLLMGLADALHQNSRIKHYSAWRDVPRPALDIVSRSYQSTSYAFAQTDELFEWMSNSKFGIHGVWWCIDGGQRHISAAGNPITLFDPDYFGELARKNGYQLKVLKSELYSYCNVTFSASWVMLSNMSDHEAEQMDVRLQQMKLEPALSICSLDAAELIAQPYAGLHAGFLPIQTDLPFNFHNDQLTSQWNNYISAG